MAIRDEEDLLKSVRTHIKNNLNTKISAIDTEKDDFTLDQITADDDHFIVAGEVAEIPNHIFCMLTIDGEIENQSSGNDASSQLNILIKVVFADTGKVDCYYRALRYMRALSETMLEYESATSEVAGLQITKSMPMILEVDRRQLITSGISVNIKIA